MADSNEVSVTVLAAPSLATDDFSLTASSTPFYNQVIHVRDSCSA